MLDSGSLIVFKAVFNRTRDWADIEAIVAADREGAIEGLRRLIHLVGEADSATVRLSELVI